MRDARGRARGRSKRGHLDHRHALPLRRRGLGGPRRVFGARRRDGRGGPFSRGSEGAVRRMYVTGRARKTSRGHCFTKSVRRPEPQARSLGGAARVGQRIHSRWHADARGGRRVQADVLIGPRGAAGRPLFGGHRAHHGGALREPDHHAHVEPDFESRVHAAASDRVDRRPRRRRDGLAVRTGRVPPQALRALAVQQHVRLPRHRPRRGRRGHLEDHRPHALQGGRGVRRVDDGGGGRRGPHLPQHQADPRRLAQRRVRRHRGRLRGSDGAATGVGSGRGT
mmetsp:Transcript_18616/g.74331  ORF Transcript_18616/g.74331 Transcript_18616/m.74331 type:complete len:281 (-) Transcript_18616:273-1115(-)